MRVEPALARLRTRARLATLFPAVPLADALARLGFVQADPIRAPARAQDLILRHRVRGYRAGDLERGFARLGLEEEFLYAYGFMPGATSRLMHPRSGQPGVADPLAAEVLAFVRARGPTHPRDLEAQFGRIRAENNWGGFSKATTRALEQLRHDGLLRVVARRDGIRIYGPAPSPPPPMDPEVRARDLVLLITRILAPVPLTSLGGAVSLMRRRNPALGPMTPVVQALLRAGVIEAETVEGETYLSPAAEAADTDFPRDVRLLAPFDPLVWDRRRFERLWGWAYRFEAYTPPARRRLGYYAMPLLWGDAVIGWANVALSGGRVDATLGYVGPAPKTLLFRRALDAELARMERFLTPVCQAGSSDRRSQVVGSCSKAGLPGGS